MSARKLKEAFDPFYQAPIEVWERFASLCEEVHFKKNEVLKAEHTRAHYGYFLLQGAVGNFIQSENSLACLDFYFEGSFFGDDYSLATGLESPVEIVALEESDVLQISRANMEMLKETPIGKTLFLVGEQQDNAKTYQQRIDLLTKSPEERYKELLEERRDIFQRVSQKHIASYLGITKQSLSRLRRRLSESEEL